MIYAAVCGSVMIVLTVLTRVLFLHRLPKQSFRILWILAALRLILPFSVTIEVETIAVPYMPTESYTVQAGTYDVLQAEISDDTADDAVPTFDVSALAAVILPLGSMIIGGSFVCAYRRMRRIALGGRPIGEYANVRVGDGAGSPFSCGVIRPVIFIPENMLSLDGDRLKYIIAHEQRHIKSGDQLVKWLIAAAVCLNWYNPLVWLMWRLASRDIELACDESVVRDGGTAADYALCLIDAAEEYSGLSHTAVCSFGAHRLFGEKALSERIRCIMMAKRLTVCGFISAALILAAMSAFFVQVTAKEMDGIDETAPSVADSADTAEIFENDCVMTDRYDHCIYECESDGMSSEELCDAIVKESTSLICPLAEHGEITSRFGTHVNPVGVTYFNNGINVAATHGAPVYAAAGGTVVTAEYDFKQGNFVVIDHGSDCKTVYRHLDTLYCKIGDEIKAGCELGTVGQTGSATGANLGFSIIADGAYASPEALFE